MLQIFRSVDADPRILWCGGSDDEDEGGGDDGTNYPSDDQDPTDTSDTSGNEPEEDD